MFLKVEKKSFVLMHCWLKLNAQPKWQMSTTNAIKTANIGNEEDVGDPTDPTNSCPRLEEDYEERSKRRRKRSEKGWRPR